MSENTLGDFMSQRLSDKEGELFVKLVVLFEDEDLAHEVAEHMDNLLYNAKLIHRLWKQSQGDSKKRDKRKATNG